MRDGRTFGIGPLARQAGVGALLVAATCGGALAKEVQFPEAKPKVAMTVPDDWTVTYTPVGVEIEAPGGDSLVVANLLKHDMGTVDAWKAKVLAVMERHGVTVDTGGGAAKAATAGSGKAPAAGQGPDLAMPGNAERPSFAFVGGPSLETPNLPTGMQPLASTGAAAPSFAQPSAGAARHGAATVNGMQFKSYRLEGGFFAGKPTDMQLVLFALPKDEFFAVEQQSASDDNRASAILNSVHHLH